MPLFFIHRLSLYKTPEEVGIAKLSSVGWAFLLFLGFGVVITKTLARFGQAGQNYFYLSAVHRAHTAMKCALQNIYVETSYIW